MEDTVADEILEGIAFERTFNAVLREAVSSPQEINPPMLIIRANLEDYASLFSQQEYDDLFRAAVRYLRPTGSI